MGLMASFWGALEEADARALAATRETFGGVFDALDSVCSLASFSLSSAAGPSAAVSFASQPVSQDDFMTFTETLISEVEAMFFQRETVSSEFESRMRSTELTQVVSDDLSPASLSVFDALPSSVQAVHKELAVLLSEQTLCGASSVIASHFEASEKLKKEEESREHYQDFCEVDVFVQSSSRVCGMEDLDVDSLTHILSFLDNSSLQACSLVSHQLLEASNFARSDMKLQGRTPTNMLPQLLIRFSGILSLCVSDDFAIKTVDEDWFDDSAMRLIAKHCKHLQSLGLAGVWSVSEKGLTAVLRGCPELKALRLHSRGGPSSSFAPSDGSRAFLLRPMALEHFCSVRWPSSSSAPSGGPRAVLLRPVALEQFCSVRWRSSSSAPSDGARAFLLLSSSAPSDGPRAVLLRPMAPEQSYSVRWPPSSLTPSDGPRAVLLRPMALEQSCSV